MLREGRHNKGTATTQFSAGNSQRCGRLLAEILFLILVLAHCSGTSALAEHPEAQPELRQPSIPILGTMLDFRNQVIGVVVHVQIEFIERQDHEGLRIRFRTAPGRFSARAQQAVLKAIKRAADAATLRDDSWTIILTLVNPGVTLYGDSLSAMVGLSVVALARGDPLYPDRVITGTITGGGRIGIVGGVPYKIRAAYASQLRRVVIPEEQYIPDGDWRAPFLMQVSPVGNLRKAYYALTDHPF